VDDLITFLRDRLAEDEQTATAVFRDHTWSVYLEGGNDGYAIEGAHSGEPGCIVGDQAMATHIALHDPARVLREVEAKRQIVDEHCDDNGRCNVCADPPQYDATWQPYPCLTLRLLALPYVDHPQYQETWKP
jgi:hypothetical protein